MQGGGKIYKGMGADAEYADTAHNRATLLAGSASVCEVGGLGEL